MILNQTLLKVCDNSGIKVVKCFKVYKHKTASIGDIFLSSVKDIKSKSKLKKGDIVKGIVVRKKKLLNRFTGNFMLFDYNEVVLLNNKNELLGTRVFGPIVLELRKRGFVKLLSLASFLI